MEGRERSLPQNYLASHLLCSVNPSFLKFKVTQLYFLQKVIKSFRNLLWQVPGISPGPWEVLLLVITIVIVTIITIIIMTVIIISF